MKRQSLVAKLLCLVATCVFAACGGGAGEADHVSTPAADASGSTISTPPLSKKQESWDVVADFSLASNPSGAWKYAFDVSAQPPQVMAATSPNCVSLTIPCWKMASDAIELPLIGINASDAVVSFGTVAIPPRVVVMHPWVVPSTGVVQRPVLQWTAPKKGIYAITGTFRIIDLIPSGVRIIVKSGTDELLNSQLTGYNHVFPVNLQVVVSKGQVISFTLDPDGTHANDSTSLQLIIARVKTENEDEDE